MKRVRIAGPIGSKRPFTPMPGNDDDTGERIAEALEHIARALSAIDHNLELVTQHLLKKAG